MDIEKKKNILDRNIARKLTNEKAAEEYGVSSRHFSRIKAHYIETGEIKSTRGCVIPFIPEEAILLFTYLTICHLEKMKDLLEKVCEKIEKNFNTVNKQRKIFSYPCLSYYKPNPNQIVIPIKSEVEYKGGIKFIIDKEKYDVMFEYVSEVKENEELINGENDYNYMKLIFYIINVMSKTYFQHVKDRPKIKIETKEKFERYYKEFGKYTETEGNKEELKAILNKLLDKNNINIVSFSPLPEYDNYSLFQPPRFSEEELDDCHSYNDYRDDSISPYSLSPQSITLSSPLTSPRSSPRSLSRSRSPRNRFDYSREKNYPLLSPCVY